MSFWRFLGCALDFCTFNARFFHLLSVCLTDPTCPLPSKKKILGWTKDWHDLSQSGSVRSWPRNGIVDSPFKVGRVAPIRHLIGGDHPERICIDIAHTYAIAGYGKDELASLLVFLAVRCKVWGNANYEIQLERAYESFAAWCSRNKKTTTVLEFSKKELEISSLLNLLGFF